MSLVNLPALLKSTTEIAPRFLLTFSIVGFIYLFLPDEIADSLGVLGFRDSFKTYIGPFSILFFALGIIDIVPRIINRIRKHFRKRRIIKELLTLTKRERFYVVYCLLRKQNTIYLRASDPSGTSLCSKGLFYLSVNDGPVNILAVPYIIHDFVFDYVKKRPHTVVSDNDSKSRELNHAMDQFDKEQQYELDGPFSRYRM